MLARGDRVELQLEDHRGPVLTDISNGAAALALWEDGQGLEFSCRIPNSERGHRFIALG
jgi:hypothetical protein